MLKSALLASALCLAFVAPAFAADQVACDEAGLTKLRASIDTMTDKEKQKASITAWEAAQAAMKANDTKTCNERIGDTGKSMEGGGATPTN